LRLNQPRYNYRAMPGEQQSDGQSDQGGAEQGEEGGRQGGAGGNESTIPGHIGVTVEIRGGQHGGIQRKISIDPTRSPLPPDEQRGER
jgi:hypothetical protein